LCIAYPDAYRQQVVDLMHDGDALRTLGVSNRNPKKLEQYREFSVLLEVTPFSPHL
jgi:hypothetical protein